MEEIERQLGESRHWSLKGEVTAGSRPKDSLLETDVEFLIGKRARKSIPTAVVDESEEDEQPENDIEKYIVRIVQDRVCNRLFDNVQLKQCPVDENLKSISTEDLLDSTVVTTKSKKGLSDEYAPKRQLEDGDTDIKIAEQTVLKDWLDVRRKLDMLSSNYYIPKKKSAVKSAVKS